MSNIVGHSGVGRRDSRTPISGNIKNTRKNTKSDQRTHPNLNFELANGSTGSQFRRHRIKSRRATSLSLRNKTVDFTSCYKSSHRNFAIIHQISVQYVAAVDFNSSVTLRRRRTL